MKQRTEKQQKKINKTKSWFFDQITKIDKSWLDWIRNKEKMTQITKIKNERGDTTLSRTEITKYYKRVLCTNVCQYIR